MWDLPGPGLEPVSPVLAGGFLTTAPPGKSPLLLLVRTRMTGKRVEKGDGLLVVKEAYIRLP